MHKIPEDLLIMFMVCWPIICSFIDVYPGEVFMTFFKEWAEYSFRAFLLDLAWIAVALWFVVIYSNIARLFLCIGVVAFCSFQWKKVALLPKEHRRPKVWIAYMVARSLGLLCSFFALYMSVNLLLGYYE